jgi:hypothetical protein
VRSASYKSALIANCPCPSHFFYSAPAAELSAKRLAKKLASPKTLPDDRLGRFKIYAVSFGKQQPGKIGATAPSAALMWLRAVS